MITDYIIITDDGKLKTSEIIAELKRYFEVDCEWSMEELDKQFLPPTQPTVRKFLASQEPDEEFRGKSVRDVDMDGKVGINLRERLLMEKEYLKLTGNHLDVEGITFCSGTHSNGISPRQWRLRGFKKEAGVIYYGLPLVNWLSHKRSLDVSKSCYGVDHSHPRFGIRRAVA